MIRAWIPVCTTGIEQSNRKLTGRVNSCHRLSGLISVKYTQLEGDSFLLSFICMLISIALCPALLVTVGEIGHASPGSLPDGVARLGDNL